MPASVTTILAILLLLSAGVVLVRRGAYRGRPRLTATLLIGTCALTTVAASIALAVVL